MKSLMIFYTILFLLSSVFAQVTPTTNWKLIWNKNLEIDMSYYEIFRNDISPATSLLDTINHIPIQENDTTMIYVDDNLIKGQIYYYRLKAVNNSEGKSEFSEEVFASIPNIFATSFVVTYSNYVLFDSIFTDPLYSSTEQLVDVFNNKYKCY